ncbi:hypothetical protein [Thermus sp.]
MLEVVDTLKKLLCLLRLPHRGSATPLEDTLRYARTLLQRVFHGVSS